MIKRITIDKIYFSSQSKSGDPYVSKKTGQPFKKVDIYAKDLSEGAKSVGGFAFPDSPVNAWKEKMMVVVEITPRTYQGKTYLDFKPASENVGMLLEIKERLDKMEPDIKELQDAVFASDEEAAESQKKAMKSIPQGLLDDKINVKGEDYKPSEIPF